MEEEKEEKDQATQWGNQAALSVNSGNWSDYQRKVRLLVGTRLRVSAEMALHCFDDVTHIHRT